LFLTVKLRFLYLKATHVTDVFELSSGSCLTVTCSGSCTGSTPGGGGIEEPKPGWEAVDCALASSASCFMSTFSSLILQVENHVQA